MTASVSTQDARHSLESAVLRGRRALISMQDPEGFWKGELRAHVTNDVEVLLAHQFLGIRTEQETAEAARWIRAQQGDDGAWRETYSGPPMLSVTVAAYIALRLAGDDLHAEHMARARTFIVQAGGIEAVRGFLPFWLAMLGHWSWDELPVVPPEMMFLPRWAALNVYDWASWVRVVMVPLMIVTSLRPRHELGVDLDELRSHGSGTTKPPMAARRGRWRSSRRRRQITPLRRAALRRAVDWIIERQQADGTWYGALPVTVWSLIALHVADYPLEHPVTSAAIAGIERFTIRERQYDAVVLRREPANTHVWDTALTMTALADAGLSADDPVLVRAAEWLLGQQSTEPGDWAVGRPGLKPGGWAYQTANRLYPDTDDTSRVILALRRVRHQCLQGDLQAAIGRAEVWIAGMQCHDGGWGSFDADNTSRRCARLPIGKGLYLIDPPTEDVTAHVIEALGRDSLVGMAPINDGVAWLRSAQQATGSWFGRWAVNHLYGTGAVLPALVAAGVPTGDRMIRDAVAWLEAHQNPDGGWGEDVRSYTDPTWIGRGESTPTQTAWALFALLAAGERSRRCTERGVAWLIEHQLPDGTWDDLNFHNNSLVDKTGYGTRTYTHQTNAYALTALGRYWGAMKNDRETDLGARAPEPADDARFGAVESDGGPRSAPEIPDVGAYQFRKRTPDNSPHADYPPWFTTGGIAGRLVGHVPPAVRGYLRLMRLHGPIGSWLFLFPGWWSISLASRGMPGWRLMALFALGAVLIRGSGCTINDIIDREIDARVERTATRPIPSGSVTVRQALVFGVVQSIAALLILAFVSLPVAVLTAACYGLIIPYPFMKRFTYWPQAWLGLAFNWYALAGWLAVTGRIGVPAIALYTAGFFWTLGYDTVYAHQDKKSDMELGIKSTALLLREKTRGWLLLFYSASLAAIVAAGATARVGPIFYLLLVPAAGGLLWEAAAVRIDDPADCQRRFLAHRFVGWSVLVAILASKML